MQKTAFRAFLPAAAVAAMVLSSCATTKIGTVWKDEGYQDHPKKMMIIAGLKKPVNRRLFEDEMARQLKAGGTDAVASYTVMPELEGANRDTVVAKMNEAGADSVLVARIMDKKAVTSYVPSGPRMAPTGGYGPAGSGWHGYYSYNPGYVVQDEFAVLQTNIFDLKTDKLVWTAASETWLSEDDDRLIKTFIGVVMDRLAKDKLLAPAGKR